MKEIEILIQQLEQQIKNMRAESFKNGRWQVPAAQLKNRQNDYRMLKFQLQAANEAMRAGTYKVMGTGTHVERKNLLPLVLRREFLALAKNDPDSEDFGYRPDGEFFTFDSKTEPVEVPYCGCGTVDENINTVDQIADHLEKCTNILTRIVDIESYTARHVRGSWLCRGCLLAAPPDLEQIAKPSDPEVSVFFNPERQLRWCPQFILSLADLGPVRYGIELKQARSQDHGFVNPVCYAGLLHSESRISEDQVELIWKCDTCSFEQRKTELLELPKPVQPGETLVTGLDTKPEVVQALAEEPREGQEE